MRNSLTSARLAALLALFAAGCGGNGVPMQKTVKTTGTVRLDGQPAAGVDVRFIPKDKTNFKLDETPLGHTDAAGQFALTTYMTGDGAPPGDYLVAVSYPDQVPDSTLPAEAEELDETQLLVAANKAKKERRKAGKPRFPALYQVPQKSGLTATVPDSDSELPPFELTTPKK